MDHQLLAHQPLPSPPPIPSPLVPMNTNNMESAPMPLVLPLEPPEPSANKNPTNDMNFIHWQHIRLKFASTIATPLQNITIILSLFYWINLVEGMVVGWLEKIHPLRTITAIAWPWGKKWLIEAS